MKLAFENSLISKLKISQKYVDHSKMLRVYNSSQTTSEDPFSN